MSTATADALREEVRRRYAESARAVSFGREGELRRRFLLHRRDRKLRRGAVCTPASVGELPTAATLASLGCGNPTAVADLREGETVLDLGSGGGIDVILSAKRVGPTGIAYGLDMTDDMLALARSNAEEAGVRNAIFLRGLIEDVPLPVRTRSTSSSRTA